MKIRSSTSSLLKKAFIDSFSLELMTTIADELIKGYDLHKSTGIPDSIPIQKVEAAKQVVDDVIKSGLFVHLMSLLVDIHYNGLMGRKYPIPNIRNIINEIQGYGYLYDKKNKMFVEDSSVRITRNWGVLLKDEEYTFSFLRLDIVGNTKLVKKYPNDVIQKTYSRLHEIVKNAVTKRIGRIWNWEGDGGMIAFLFSKKELFAALSAMEIIHNLYLFNKLENRLGQPIEIRLAVHAGPCIYSDDEEDIKKSETIKELIEIESKHTDSNTATFSTTAAMSLDTVLIDQLTPIKEKNKIRFYKYELNWER